MADDDQIDFEAIAREEDNPTELNFSQGNEGEMFNVPTLAAAAQLSKYPAGLRLLYLVRKSGAPNFYERDRSTWTVGEDFIYSMAMAGAGSSRLRKNEPLGSTKWEYVQELEDATADAIKATLFEDRSATVSIVTDVSLVRVLASTKGVRILEDRTNKTAVIRYPGYSEDVVISLQGWTKGRIVLNGEHFVNWYNRTYNNSMVYLPMCPEARRMASIFSLFYRIDNVKDEVVNFADQKVNWTHQLLRAYGEPSKHMSAMAAQLKKLAAKAYKKPENRQPAGMGLKTQEYYEFLMHKVVAMLSNDGLRVLRVELERVEAEEKTRWEKFTMSNGDLFGTPDEKSMNTLWTKFSKGEVKPPGADSRMATKGNVLKYVEDSRKHARDSHDLMRKSDALTSGSVCGSITSVPVKILTAISYLKSMLGEKDDFKFPKVDAWGIASANHWYHTVNDHAAAVTWRDRDKNCEMPLGNEGFIVSDIETIPANSRDGWALFDDTYNARAEGMPMNADAKVKAILTSGYECGFIKLYYGSGSEANVKISSLIPYAEAFYDVYEQVAFAPGGSPHSPEYYLVFCRKRPPPNAKGFREVTHLWEPPKRKGVDPWPKPSNKFLDPIPLLEDGSVDVAAHAKQKTVVTAYLRMWHTIYGFEMVRMNACINFDVLNCSRIAMVPNHVCVPEHQPVYRLSGSREPGTRAREEDLASEVPGEEPLEFY